MAPKRKNNSKKCSSQTTKQRRLSKRVVGSMVLHNKNKSIVATQEKKQSQSKGKQNKKYVANDNTENQLDVIIEEDTSKDPKSMSIDSNNINSSNQELSTSDSDCSNKSNIDIQVKTLSANQFDTDDDDDDEFQAMFMSNALKSKTRPDYASTPLVRSQYHNQSTVCTTAKSDLSHRIKNKSRGPLSTNTIDNQLTMSNTPSTNSNTPTNPRVNTNPSPLSQVSIGSQPLSSINYTTNSSAILETFVEYRTLKRDLQRALNLNETWKADYQVLVRRMQRLEKSSFPRPNADGRAFLEQLLDSISSSDRDEDNRSSNQLAHDIGLPETTLLSCSNAEPQKTALRIFNALFPTNQDKQSLVSVVNLNLNHPALLENILIFTRRCAPGCGYSMEMLKEAVGNSIRCARHKIKVEQSRIVAAAAMQYAQPNDENGMME